MNNLKGIALMVAAMAGFSMTDAFVKLLSAQMPLGQIVTILSLGSLVVFGSMALLRREPLFTGVFFHPVIMIRNAAEIVGGVGFMAALALTPISQASAILQATPLAVTLGAFLFLGEDVGWRRWLAVLVGFAGVLIVMRPGTDGFDANALFAVIGVLGLSARDLATRRAPAVIPSFVLATYAMISMTLAGLFVSLFQGPYTPLTATLAGQSLAMIVLGSLGYFAITLAMRVGEISAVAPFRYTRILFALVIGGTFFGEVPDVWMIAGSTLIIGSGLYAFLRERKHATVLPSVAPPG